MPATPEWPRTRVVALENGRNFRDLGGYPAADGRRVRWGLLFRSGSMAGLSAADRAHLRARGVRAVCDLRSTHERETEPFPVAEFEGLNYWSRDYPTSFADLRRTMQGGVTTAAAARDAMLAGYRTLPFEQASAYARIFAFLNEGHVPLVFNCTAGKDRAGTAAALVLSALGVSREIVVEDFVLTNTVYDVQRVVLSREGGMATQRPPEVRAAIAQADPAYIAAALDAVDARHGGIAGYLRDVAGIDAPALAAIRDRLLEPAAA